MTIKIKNTQRKRLKQLSSDTAKVIYHPCYGLVDLCNHLLSTTHEYVALGKFSSDPVENAFG